jgi:predicted nucleic acid-binding protein
VDLIVVDASVTIKWFEPSLDEADLSNALEIFAAVNHGKVTLCQPPHWLAEVAAVLARLDPENALDDLADLYEIRFRRIESKSVYLAACTMSCDLQHHLFDTLYHAVALSLDNAVYVTADQRYYSKANRYGSISLLSDFTVDRSDEQNSRR